MTVLTAVELVLAGFGGGLSGSMAGMASLVSYPALLALGLPPVTANVTNTVALVFSSTGAIAGSRPELSGQRHRIIRLGAAAVAGGIAGGLLLLATSSTSFAKIVPFLIGAASLGVLLRRDPARILASDHHRLGMGLFIWMFFIGIYGGYFGAAAGVLMLAVLLWSHDTDLPRANAMKNILLGAANAVAAVAFAIFGHVHWSFVPPLAVGFFVGGRLGPVIVRGVPAQPLRIVISLCGVGLAIHLGLDAFR